MFPVLVHQGWSLIVRIGVVIYCENLLQKVVICLENLQFCFQGRSLVPANNNSVTFKTKVLRGESTFYSLLFRVVGNIILSMTG